MILMVTPFECASEIILNQICKVSSLIDGVILRLDDTEEQIGNLIERLKEKGLTEKIIVHNHPELMFKHHLSKIHFKENNSDAATFKNKYPDVISSMSTHSKTSVETAISYGMDYCLFGHVFSTDSKPGIPPRQKMLSDEIASMDIPVVAIGGINEYTINELNTSFTGFAGITLFQNERELIKTRKVWLLRTMK